MVNRRKFLQTSAVTACGGLLLPRQASAFLRKPSGHPIGLQLYTLFNTIDEDVEGSLKKIATIGYKEIESAFSKKGGFYGMKPKEFASLLKDLGMSWQSHHTVGAPRPAGAKPPMGVDGKPIILPQMKNLTDNMQEIVDDVASAGVPYLVCSTSPVGTLDEIKSSIIVLNKTATACHKAGVTFAYHNHDRDFKEVDGKIPYEMIMAESDPNLLKFELDLAWATKVGKNPVEMFKQHPGRFPLWHVKDIEKDLATIGPVGGGIVDFKEIFANAKTAGMKHFFVEHDSPKDGFASITASYKYLTETLRV